MARRALDFSRAESKGDDEGIITSHLDWPFSAEIETRAPSYGDAPFGDRGLVYVFDYTLASDRVTPIIFEVQSLSESTVSLLYTRQAHHNSALVNYRVKEKILREIGINNFTINAHPSFCKAKQREILNSHGCADLQPAHLIVEAIIDHGYGVNYEKLCSARLQKISDFVEGNRGKNLVLKLSSAARGEGNCFIKADELTVSDDPAHLIVERMGDLCQDAEFSLEVEAQHYESLDGKKVTFRSIVAVDCEGRARGLKKWATLHDSANSHVDDKRRYDFVECVAFSSRDSKPMMARCCRLEPAVEHHLTRAALAFRNAAEKILEEGAEIAFELKPSVTFGRAAAAHLAKNPTSLREYVEALTELFEERVSEKSCFPCFDKKLTPPRLAWLQEELEKPSKNLFGKEAALFVEKPLFYLLKDAEEKDVAEGRGQRIGDFVRKLNNFANPYFDPSKKKGFYKIKKLIWKMMLACGYAQPTESEDEKAGFTAFLLNDLTEEQLRDFLTRYEEGILTKDKGSAAKYDEESIGDESTADASFAVSSLTKPLIAKAAFERPHYSSNSTIRF